MLTRQAFVNDDLGVLSNAARIQGTGAALTETTVTNRSARVGWELRMKDRDLNERPKS